MSDIYYQFYYHGNIESISESDIRFYATIKGVDTGYYVIAKNLSQETIIFLKLKGSDIREISEDKYYEYNDQITHINFAYLFKNQ